MARQRIGVEPLTQLEKTKQYNAKMKALGAIKTWVNPATGRSIRSERPAIRSRGEIAVTALFAENWLEL